MKRSGPPKRRTPLRPRSGLRPGQPPAQRTRLRPASPGHADVEADYATVRLEVQWRARGLCEAQASPDCTGRGVLAHHIQTRHPRDDSPGNLLWLCDPCHREIHARPVRSYMHGWLRRHET